MCRTLLPIALALLAAAMPAAARLPHGAEWMRPVADTTLLCAMAIPGAHDAATGHGFRGLKGALAAPFARTQTLTLEEQWAAGVRAFDLRPAARGKRLPILHGSIETNLTLPEALGRIAALLRAHPAETAVILLRCEAPGGDWSAMTAAAIEQSGLRLAELTDSLTLGQARGKALILSRTEVSLRGVATVEGWRHDAIDTVRAADGVRIIVQDLYDCTAEGAAGRKEAMIRALDSAPGWVINHLSGFTRRRSARSSRRMSERMRKSAPRKGLLMADFVSVPAKD